MGIAAQHIMESGLQGLCAIPYCTQFESVFYPYVNLASGLYNRSVLDLKKRGHRQSAEYWFKDVDNDGPLSVSSCAYWLGLTPESLWKMAKQGVTIDYIRSKGERGGVVVGRQARCGNGALEKHPCKWPGCNGETTIDYCRRHSSIASCRKNKFKEEFGRTPPDSYIHLPILPPGPAKKSLVQIYIETYGVHP